MANFLEAISLVLKQEGGLSNRPSDKGKITNMGISLRFLQRINPSATEDTIRNLTKEDAVQLYKTEFWDKCKFGMIEDQSVANLLMSLAVNMGSATAIKFAQRSMRAVIGQYIVEDGNIGAITLTAINRADSKCLCVAIKCFADVYYHGLNSEEYLQGWLTRLYG